MQGSDFRVPWSGLIKLLLFCALLLILSPVWKVQRAGPRLVPIAGVSPGGPLTAPARRLEGSGLVLHSSDSPEEHVILRSQLESPDQMVELVPTWPEYLGFSLAGLFLLATLRMGYLFACWAGTGSAPPHDPGGWTALEASLLTYGVGALLGWFWLSPWPFLAMGLACRIYAMVRESGRCWSLGAQ